MWYDILKSVSTHCLQLACEGGNWSLKNECISTQARGQRIDLGSGSSCEKCVLPPSTVLTVCSFQGYCDKSGVCVTVDSDVRTLDMINMLTENTIGSSE